jgi:hypothetical protein
MEQLLDVRIGNDAIPVVKNPKILGETFDPQLKFHEHVVAISSKVRRNANVLKALASTKEGQDKETMLATFKAICRAHNDYAAPVWSPSISETSLKKLQVAQNGALRVALGVHMMASEDHLHVEAKELKVKEHLDLLAAQYLASCYDPDHACHEMSMQPDRRRFPRKVFTTLTDKHQEWVEATRIWDPGGVPNCRLARQELHSAAVIRAKAARSNNRVLGVQPPLVSGQEKRLPRCCRATLSQLRSGHSIFTNSYKHIILGVPDVCPNCNAAGHDVDHLFHCPARRTALAVRNLWTKPIQCSRFLNLFPERA